MKLYEFNKQGYASIPTLTPEEELMAIEVIEEFIDNTNGQYYMVLNHDIHYYTLYNWSGMCSSALAEDVFALMKEIGEIKSVELAEGGHMVEIWVLNAVTNEANMYGFFNYDAGVIEI